MLFLNGMRFVRSVLLLGAASGLGACGGRAAVTTAGDDSGGNTGVGGSASTGGSVSPGGVGGQRPVPTGGAGSGGRASSSGGTSSGGTTSDGGSGGASATGGMGGSEPDGNGGLPSSCEGLVPDCMQEGVVSCNDEGMRMRCGECLVNEPVGEDCARVLTADKEGNTVCAVTGVQDMYCVGDVRWRPDVEFPQALESFPMVVALYGDTSGISELMPYCQVNLYGEVRCEFAGSSSSSDDCTHVAISDHGLFCTICDGTLHCEDTLQHEVVAEVEGAQGVVIEDLTIYYITPDGQVDDQYPNVGPYLGDGVFRAIDVDGAETLCGLTDDRLVCERQGMRLELAGQYLQMSAGAQQVCVLDTAWAVHCYDYGESSFVPSYAPQGRFEKVVCTSQHSCALTEAGDVQCWNLSGDLEYDSWPFL